MLRVYGTTLYCSPINPKPYVLCTHAELEVCPRPPLHQPRDPWPEAKSRAKKGAAKLNFITIIVITTIIVAIIIIIVIQIRIRIKYKGASDSPQLERLLSGGFPWPSERCKEAAESERALVTGRARGFRVSGSGGGGGGNRERRTLRGQLEWRCCGYYRSTFYIIRFASRGCHTRGTLRRVSLSIFLRNCLDLDFTDFTVWSFCQGCGKCQVRHVEERCCSRLRGFRALGSGVLGFGV